MTLALGELVLPGPHRLQCGTGSGMEIWLDGRGPGELAPVVGNGRVGSEVMGAGELMLPLA